MKKDWCFKTRSEECWRAKKRAEAATLDLTDTAREALELYMSCQTQWRTDFGCRTGLDYLGVEAVARALGFAWSKPVFVRLRVLEDEALVMESEEAAEKERKQKLAGGGNR